MQKEGYKGLTGLGREKPCKKNGGKRQKIGLEPWLSRIEREKKLKNFGKSEFEHVKISFKKILYTIFDQSKIDSIGWKCFDWSNTNRASIETDRDS